MEQLIPSFGHFRPFFDKIRALSLLLRFTYSIALLMVLIGVTGTFWGLFRSMPFAPAGVAGLAAVVMLSVWLMWGGLRIQSQRNFLIFLGTSWVSTRGLVVTMFPKFVLTGDERYFHDFVGRLVKACAQGQISTLSHSYDFPVWLARSFPFYLPLAALFGAKDVEAARWLNVVLGALQLICLFFIARKLAGSRIARLSCLLLMIFPYHLINALSYDPQIAGTFFLLIAVWLFLSLKNRSEYSHVALAGRGLLLGLALLGAGIQRGGIDFLFVAVMLLAGLGEVLLPGRRISTRNAICCAAAVFLVWLPLRAGFGKWVESQDSSLLRTHTLGFMSRGWNLATSGEYLPLYEELDIASSKPEKKRTLEAVLVTEFAREPVRSLLILTPVKIAKFFAIGYASTAEQGLMGGGYVRAASFYQWWQALYAPVILTLCLLGLVRCRQSAALQRRLLVLVLLMVVSCAAIVMIWETSPRYSHPIQFALLILATAGLSGFPRWSSRLRLRPALVLDFASSSAAIGICWLTLSICVVGVARSATSYQFLDPRALSASIDRKPLALEPLHSFSRSWEGAIRLPAGTSLPASVQISFPDPGVAQWDHLSVSIWLPDPPTGTATYQVSCRTGKANTGIPPAITGHISRVQVPRSASHCGSLTILIDSAAGQRSTASALRVGIGYALAN